MTGADQVYGRFESVEKDLVLLATKELPDEHAPRKLVRVLAFTGGYLREFPLVRGLDTGVGADVTLYAFPSSLDPVYSASPLSVHAFLRLRWGRHGMQEGSAHHHMM